MFCAYSACSKVLYQEMRNCVEVVLARWLELKPLQTVGSSHV